MCSGAIVGPTVTRRSRLEADLRVDPRSDARGTKPRTASTSPFGASCRRNAICPRHVATSIRVVTPVEG